MFFKLHLSNNQPVWVQKDLIKCFYPKEDSETDGGTALRFGGGSLDIVFVKENFTEVEELLIR